MVARRIRCRSRTSVRAAHLGCSRKRSDWWLTVMHRPVPEAGRRSGVVTGRPVPAPAGPRPARSAWRWTGTVAFLLILAALFAAYLRLSQTYPENSDEANILLMASDLAHGNLYLSGWNVSDVPFITTELPEIALLVRL